MRSLLLVTLLSAFSTTAANLPIPVTVYADDAYPPYSYVSDGVARGIYADIFEIAFSRMPRYHVTIIPVPFKRGLRLLESGRGFALYPPYYYANKRPYLDPYSKPVLKEEVAVFCDPKYVSNLETRTVWPDDYFGLTIGINDSFEIGGDLFWKARDEGKINVEPAKDNRENILKLRAGRTHCYVNDKLSILWELKELKRLNLIDKSTEFKLAINVSSEHGYLAYTAIAKERYPYKNDFVETLDKVILEMQNNGEIELITKKYRD
ncbi:substrate-binding periplasmic protein [Vibrio profundi]|uniref:substrate-binding periplasmic protein n=1 Tax=Vibrio profundi TaxID=1774960 RepID=UPI003735C2B4